MRNAAHEWTHKGRKREIKRDRTVQYDVNEVYYMTLKYIQVQSETVHSSKWIACSLAITELDREWIKRMLNASTA